MARNTFRVRARLEAEDRASGTFADVSTAVGGMESAATDAAASLDDLAREARAAGDAAAGAAEGATAAGAGFDDLSREALAAATAAEEAAGGLREAGDAAGGASDSASDAGSAFGRFGNFLRDRFVVTLGDVVDIAKAVAGALANLANQASVQEDAIQGLNVALRRYGEGADAASEAAQRQATALQAVTQFADEQILASQSLLVELGVQQQQLGAATEAAVGLAQAFGIDLESAARNVGRTMGGFAGELGEIVPELTQLSRESLQAGEGITFLQERFAVASDNLSRFSLNLAQAGNAFQDFQADIGGAVTQNEQANESIANLTALLSSPVLSGSLRAIADGFVTVGSAIVNNFIGPIADAVRILNELEEQIGLERVEFEVSALEQTAARLGLTVGELASRLREGAVDFDALARAADAARASGSTLGEVIDGASDALGRFTAAQVAADTAAGDLGIASEELERRLNGVRDGFDASDVAAQAAGRSFDLAAAASDGFALSAEDLSRIASELGISTEELQRTLDAMGESLRVVGVGFQGAREQAQGAADAVEQLRVASGRGSAALTLAAQAAESAADRMARLRAEAAAAGEAYQQAATGANAFGIVTSTQLLDQLTQMTLQLEVQREVLGANSEEFIRFEEIARREMANVQERIENLRNGFGELNQSVADSTGQIATYGNQAIAAAVQVDGLSDANERFVLTSTRVQRQARQTGSTLSGSSFPTTISGGTFTTFLPNPQVQPNGSVRVA